jgi:hypothetical protein
MEQNAHSAISHWSANMLYSMMITQADKNGPGLLDINDLARVAKAIDDLE